MIPIRLHLKPIKPGTIARMFQFLINNSWLMIPILIGVFNVAVRIQQKAKEQKFRRSAQQEIAKRKADALRTGKMVKDPIMVNVMPKEQPTMKDDRQARIEALRKQRMEQLRAMREKRASTAGTATPASRPTTLPSQRATQAPRPSQQLQGRPQGTARRTVIPASRKPASPTHVQAATQRPQSGSQRLAKPNPPKPSLAQQSPPKTGTTVSKKQTRSTAPTSPSARAPRSSLQSMSARSMLRDPKQVRQAIVLRELLDAPIALRDPDQGPGTLQI